MNLIWEPPKDLPNRAKQKHIVSWLAANEIPPSLVDSTYPIVIDGERVIYSRYLLNGDGSLYVGQDGGIARDLNHSSPIAISYKEYTEWQCLSRSPISARALLRAIIRNG